MAEAILDWPVIMANIKAELASVTKPDGSPVFTAIIEGEPWAPLVDVTWCAFWYAGRVAPTHTGGAQQTLDNVMYAAEIEFVGYWPIPDMAVLPALDAEIATVDTNIRRRIRANSTLNSEVTDLDITDSRAVYANFPNAVAELRGLTYRVLTMQIILDNLEGEPISA